MVFDTRLSWSIFVILLLCIIFPFLEGYHLLLVGDRAVRLIENSQALMLFFFAVFTYFYMRPLQLKSGQKEFWLWAICWWLVLFGRSTSWGRDYFPDVPKIYFRAISIVLIASILFPLFGLNLRQEISQKFKTVVIPVWGLVLAVAGLIISDAIEHDRAISAIFLHDIANKNFMEELYEYPLILGLFIVAFAVMKKDKQANIEIKS